MSTPELKPLLDCPFCGATAQPQDDDSFVSHDLGCFFTHQYAQETWLVGSRAKKRWNTRHNPAESALNAAREALAFALTKEEGDMSDAEQCGGWDEVDWINAHARANRYRTALAQISPQQSKTT